MNPGMYLETLQPSGNAPHEVVITAVAPQSQNGYTYNWDFGNGVTRTTTGLNTDYTYTIEGEYIISCTAVENITGMMYQASYTINVSPTPLVPESYSIERVSNPPSSVRSVDIGNLKIFNNNSVELTNGFGYRTLTRFVDGNFKIWEERIQACILLPGNKVYVFIKLVGLNEDGMENGDERSWAEGAVPGTDQFVDRNNDTFDRKMYYSDYYNYSIEQTQQQTFDTGTVVRSVEMQEVGMGGGTITSTSFIGNSFLAVRLRTWNWNDVAYTEVIDKVYKKQNENGRWHYIVLLKMTIGAKDCFAWHNGVGAFFYNESYCSINTDFDTGYVLTSL